MKIVKIFIFLIIIVIVSGCSSSEKVYCNRGPLWCYKTLAGSDCYAQRVEGWDSRLVARETNVAYNAPINCEQIKDTEERDAPPEDYDATLDRLSTVAKVGGIIFFIYSLAGLL